MVDAGTAELIRSLGKEIISSANLVSQFEAVLTEAQIATHYEAQKKLDAILGSRLERDGPPSPRRQQRCRRGSAWSSYLHHAIRREGMVTEHGPNVSVGPNSADSHYEPSRASSRPIRRGDFVLIDIWSKLIDRPEAVWYDITWTGIVDRDPTEREQLVFDTVRDARDAAIEVIQAAFTANEPIPGWEADDAAREVIHRAGFGEYFTHRTGHNIATELHGSGAHLDNLETHDERLIPSPNTCLCRARNLLPWGAWCTQ